MRNGSLVPVMIVRSSYGELSDLAKKPVLHFKSRAALEWPSLFDTNLQSGEEILGSVKNFLVIKCPVMVRYLMMRSGYDTF